ncbi:MAG: cytochrome c [Bacteroidales bacterium]
MMRYLTEVKIVGVIFMAVIFTTACHRDNNNPGYDYLPEMDLSRAYEAYSENPVHKDGKTMQAPVEGTVPRGKIPYPYEKDDEDLLLAGKTIFNPLEYTSENIERGEVLYNRFCINCHGINGDGQGNLFTSGVYKFPPGNLTQEASINRPDGELYHIITVGRGIMGAHGPQIRPEDRWKIIMYVRKELQQPL